MRLKVIACKVLMRELYTLAAKSNNVVDIIWLKQALHNEPDRLRAQLQTAIDRIEGEEEQYDAILIGYGLCSNGIVGLHTQRTPLVIPRAHDCISLLLGSRKRYQELFDEHSGGIYWYSRGWLEHSLMPGKDRHDKQYQEYAEKYGEDNAQYLMDMEQGWMKEYNLAVGIWWPSIGREPVEGETRSSAEFLKWNCRMEEGSDALLWRMLEGHWDKEDFLVVPPGSKVVPSFTEGIVRAEST